MKKEFHNERNILKTTHSTIIYIIKNYNDNERGGYPNKKKHTYYKLLQMAQVRKNNKILSDLFGTRQT